MTNLVFSIIFYVSAISIIIYDYKIQKIPLWLVLTNYTMICLLINPIILVGNIFILLLKKLDKPIDIIYIFTMSYLILINNNIYSSIGIIIMLLFIILSKDKVSLMVPLEIIGILEILVKEL